MPAPNDHTTSAASNVGSSTPRSNKTPESLAAPLYSAERRAEFPPGTTNLEIALTDALNEVALNTRRMLQALDIYWFFCEGMPKGRYPRGRYTAEDWWHRYEKYRALVEEVVHRYEKYRALVEELVT